ncbi:MAG: ATP-binding protein [Vicinamibacterales bacterium]
MSRAPARHGRMLGWRLLGPMIVTWAVLAAAGVVALSVEAERRLEQAMMGRAEELANLINYSAESVTDVAELRRFVQKAAAEPHVQVIVVAAGTPARVVASSRAAWHGQLVSELGHPNLAADVDAALGEDGPHHHFHPERHRFDYATSLQLSLPVLPDVTLAAGAITVQLDTRTQQADIDRTRLIWIGAILMGASLATFVGYRLVKRLVLQPLADVALAVRDHREDDDEAWVSSGTGDELGALARTLRESIQARRHTEAALRRSERMASVGTLAAGVAHEIHTPLQFVNDSVHFMRDAADDAVVALREVRATALAVPDDAGCGHLRAALGAIVARIDDAEVDDLVARLPGAAGRSAEGLDRVEAIVRSLKACADIAPGDMAPEDLNRAVKNAVTVAERECRGFATVEFTPAELPRVVCHAGDVYEAVLHVLHNAMEAVVRRHGARSDPPAGRIRVHTRIDGEAAAITVTDNGDGIDAAIADRVFDPFFTTKEVGRGFGQGLAVAWRLVFERHGGTLSFTNPLDGGTTFTLRFPLAGPALPRDEARAA